jgi:FMN phosphatase YigB (HAD superfamily)
MADKLDCFKKILEKHQVKNPKEVFVVGDRIDSEIKYGNRLGMTTVYLNRGKYSAIKPRDENEIPNFKIQSLEELAAL